MKKALVLLVGMWLCCQCLAIAGEATSPGERRAALLTAAEKGAEGLPVLQKGLQDENAIVRRTAINLLCQLGAPATQALKDALANADPVVRAAALNAVLTLTPGSALELLENSLADPAPAVRQAAVEGLVNLSPRPGKAEALLRKGASDPDDNVRAVAVRASWPFQRVNVTLRDSKTYDHDLQVVKTIALPLDNWKFNPDPAREGHLKKWFEPAFEDSTWKPLSIGKPWDDFGVTLEGIGWYRLTFDLPEKPDLVALDLKFEAVDECAWVWLNGVYIGAHDLGLSGWDKPFAFDISKEAKWGGKNQISVRVQNAAGAGGIWKPVIIEAVK